MSQKDPNKPPTIPIDPRILLPMFGILFAPFIGFLLDANVALFILMLALGVMGWMTWSLSKNAPEAQARTLKLGAIMNIVMAVAAAALLLVRL